MRIMTLIVIPLLISFHLLSTERECGCSTEHAHFRNIDSKDLLENEVEFPEQLIISLGFNCTPCENLQRNNLRSLAFPFDWMCSSFEGLLALFENDFKDFVNPDYLFKPGAPNYVLNSKYFSSVGFWHDFDLTMENWKEEQVPEVAAKYHRRVKRLYKALQSDRTIYLFRSACSRHWPLSSIPQTKEMVVKLRDMLLAKFPQAKITLVVINEGPDTYYAHDWAIPQVKNFYMRDYQMTHEWDRIFRELGLIP